jgi:hypothetical protein
MMPAIFVLALAAQDPVPVEGQPLAAQVQRLVQALEFLGSPLAPDVRAALAEAGRDGARIQRVLDPQALLVVHLNPESRVKVARGRGEARLVQGGWTPVLVKVVNESAVRSALRISSP